jgi:serine/threonine protein kinase
LTTDLLTYVASLLLAGSLPYLAPEVVECRPYDSKCDVFSFAILAWEIFTLKEAYKGITPPEFLRRVAACGERPCIPRNLKPLIKLMLAEAWDYDPRKRPNMRRVATMLRGDLNEMSDGDEAVIHRTQHMVNRSRHSMRVLQKQHADGKILPSSHGDWKL